MANKGWFWRTFKSTVSLDHVDEPVHMISYSYKWLHEAKTHHVNIHDPLFIGKLWELLHAADAIVTYNGDGFDLKHIRREMLAAGYPPLRPCASIDLYKFVKKTYSLVSNRLDYVAEYFLGINKLDTGGFGLWKQFVAGNPAAIKKMQRYNNRDVVITEKLYKFFKPHITNHPYLTDRPVAIGDEFDTYECPTCGKLQGASGGHTRRTRCFAIRQVCCSKCGHWFDGKRKKL
jgi:uncharacterized protein YprB with RNaseH-like and TPR domain